MRIGTEADLNDELLSLYRRTGEATGYWPNYYLRSVRKRGGLAVAKDLLGPGSVSSGFDRLIAARRTDLSVEAVALLEKYRHLFTASELKVARDRLAALPPSAFPSEVLSNEAFPTDLSEGTFPEGAATRVPVNRYERSAAARAACIRHHGTRCAVCNVDFRERYGEIGSNFIHVHHKRPLATLGKSYVVDPAKDLVPVCPNCHAMLHRREPPFDVEQLRDLLQPA
jgi:5-methylcytosine-specific restriction protein A